MVFYDGKIEIDMLPAGAGDCFLIDFMEEDYRILIDGGYAKTYQIYLKNKLKLLAKKGKKINLLVITHIDSDHIGGIKTFLKENGHASNPNIIDVDEIWFNGFYHMIHENVINQELSCTQKELLVGMAGANTYDKVDGKHDISYNQGESVARLIIDNGYRWNGMYNGKAVCVDENQNIYIGKDISIELLNPSQKELNNLADDWIEYIQGRVKNFIICNNKLFDEAFENQIQYDQENMREAKNICSESIDEGNIDYFAIAQEENFTEEVDDRKANCSSIAFLLRYHNYVMLFPGDCPMQLIQSKLPNKIDILKLPHHGSDKNISVNAIRNISVDYYLLSTNGENYGHPSKRVIANVMYKSPNGAKLIKNYNIGDLHKIGVMMESENE